MISPILKPYKRPPARMRPTVAVAVYSGPLLWVLSWSAYCYCVAIVGIVMWTKLGR